MHAVHDEDVLCQVDAHGYDGHGLPLPQNKRVGERPHFPSLHCEAVSRKCALRSGRGEPFHSLVVTRRRVVASKIEEWGGWRGLILHTLLSSVVSGAVIAGVLKWTLDKELETWRSTKSWQVSALSEVVAPTVMHLSRTAALADRYRVEPRFGEAVLLRESNSTIRALLLSKAYLLPSELVPTSECLLTHYDIWLKRFDLSLARYKSSQGGAEPTADQPFDVGFASLEAAKCGGFPKDAPAKFRQQYDALRKALYGLPPSDG